MDGSSSTMAIARAMQFSVKYATVSQPGWNKTTVFAEPVPNRLRESQARTAKPGPDGSNTDVADRSGSTRRAVPELRRVARHRPGYRPPSGACATHVRHATGHGRLPAFCHKLPDCRP